MMNPCNREIPGPGLPDSPQCDDWLMQKRSLRVGKVNLLTIIDKRGILPKIEYTDKIIRLGYGYIRSLWILDMREVIII